MRFSTLNTAILCGTLVIFGVANPASARTSPNDKPTTRQSLNKAEILQDKYLARMTLHTATMSSHFKNLYKLVDDMDLVSDISIEDDKDVDIEVMTKWMSRLIKDNKPRVSAISDGKIEDALKVSKDMIEEIKELGVWMKEFSVSVKNTINDESNGRIQDSG